MPIEKTVQLSEPPAHLQNLNTRPENELRHNGILHRNRDAFTTDVDETQHSIGSGRPH